MAAVLLLSGCKGEPTDRTAGGVTPDEAKALDEAAGMVEARRLPAEALRPPVVYATPGAGGAGTGGASAGAGASSEGQTGEPKQ